MSLPAEAPRDQTQSSSPPSHPSFVPSLCFFAVFFFFLLEKVSGWIDWSVCSPSSRLLLGPHKGFLFSYSLGELYESVSRLSFSCLTGKVLFFLIPLHLTCFNDEMWREEPFCTAFSMSSGSLGENLYILILLTYIYIYIYFVYHCSLHFDRQSSEGRVILY